MSSDLGLKWTVSECPATQETTSRLRLPFFWRHMKLGPSQRRENGGYRSVMRDLLTGTEVVTSAAGRWRNQVSGSGNCGTSLP